MLAFVFFVEKMRYFDFYLYLCSDKKLEKWRFYAKKWLEK